MPIISRFYGIIIMMYWRDHSPPHFHARYGEYEIEMDIRGGKWRGTMPRRELTLIDAWRKGHIDDLLLDWTSAQNSEPLMSIKPLE